MSAIEIPAGHLLAGKLPSRGRTGEHGRQLGARRDGQRQRMGHNWAALARKWSARLSKLSAKNSMFSTPRCFKN